VTLLGLFVYSYKRLRELSTFFKKHAENLHFIKIKLFICGYLFEKFLNSKAIKRVIQQRDSGHALQKILLKDQKTFWGGEPAGDLYTNYLKPEIFTLYTTETRNELIKNYRIIPDPMGNIQVYKKFWTFTEANDHVVPPLLAYTDLMNTGDRRCIETANKIYEQILQNKFE
jgi:hypothetical protein